METVAEILAQDVLPAIGIDELGFVTSMNGSFERAYGWTRADVIGKPVTLIIPPHMRDAHRIGFSRFIETGKPSLLGRALPLPICCRDGRILAAEHFILAEKGADGWRFAATIQAR